MKAIDLIAKHEGYRKNIYKCTAGYNTIGYGLNLDVGMNEEVARMILVHQAEEIFYTATQDLQWFKKLDSVRQAVIVNMIYNLGMKGFKNFKKTIGYIEEGEYMLAAHEMMDSKWATQVGVRADELSNMMHSGEWPDDF